jgi:hypothetical protein
MKFSEITRHAIHHTTHCLIGCGTGEIIGMSVASVFGWHRIARVVLAILLSFVCGYGLTYYSVRRQTETAQQAIKITIVTDTLSIATMELVDSMIEIIIPNALIVTAASFRFWWGLALALSIAFCITVSFNRFMLIRNAKPHI